jgi:ABC transporter substrate binding protein
MFEYNISGKWVELLREIAPAVTRAAIIRDPDITAGIGQFGAIQAVAPSFGVEVSLVNVRDVGEIERAVEDFTRSPNGGLIVTATALAVVHSELIVTLAARHKLPAIYLERFFVTAGGLISYGPDFADQYQHAAGYVDRILKGKARRLAGAGACQVRAGDQPEDCQDAGFQCATDIAHARRWSYRITRQYAAGHPSGRVGKWRGGIRLNISVATPFVWRCFVVQP